MFTFFRIGRAIGRGVQNSREGRPPPLTNKEYLAQRKLDRAKARSETTTGGVIVAVVSMAVFGVLLGVTIALIKMHSGS